jgi:hypothetical protein
VLLSPVFMRIYGTFRLHAVLWERSNNSGNSANSSNSRNRRRLSLYAEFLRLWAVTYSNIFLSTLKAVDSVQKHSYLISITDKI